MAVYFLSQHPDVLRRLREEILSKIGSERRPTYNDIREMKYLRAFINGGLPSTVREIVAKHSPRRDAEAAPSCVSALVGPCALGH